MPRRAIGTPKHLRLAALLRTATRTSSPSRACTSADFSNSRDSGHGEYDVMNRPTHGITASRIGPNSYYIRRDKIEAIPKVGGSRGQAFSCKSHFRLLPFGPIIRD